MSLSNVNVIMIIMCLCCGVVMQAMMGLIAVLKSLLSGAHGHL
jgi:hypothetical protein